MKIRHLEAIKKSWNSRVRRYWVTTFLAFKGLKYVSINMKVVGDNVAFDELEDASRPVDKYDCVNIISTTAFHRLSLHPFHLQV